MSGLPPQGSQLRYTPWPPAHPVEGGEVGGGSQYIKQLPIARAGPITHKAVTASAGHVCGKEGSIGWWTGGKGQNWRVKHGWDGCTLHTVTVGIPVL